jgi:hypothetical protein
MSYYSRLLQEYTSPVSRVFDLSTQKGQGLCDKKPLLTLDECNILVGEEQEDEETDLMSILAG